MVRPVCDGFVRWVACPTSFTSGRGLFNLWSMEKIRDHSAGIDKKIEQMLEQINQDTDLPAGLEPGKRKPIRHNKPQVTDLDKHLLKVFGGRDATKLPGFTDYNWLQLYTEPGSDLSNWPSEKHFTSWLGLSPGQNNSGKRKKSKAKGKPVAGRIFKEIAHGLLNSVEKSSFVCT